MKIASRILLGSLIVLPLITFGHTASFGQTKDQLQELAAKLPATSNAIAAVRIGTIMETHRAKQGNWLKRRDKIALETIPRWVNYVVLGSEIHLRENDELWTVAITSKPDDVQIEDVAKARRSPLQSIAGKQALLSPRGAYVVQLTEKLIGAYSPPNRQALSRWIRSVESSRGTGVTDYLQGAIEQPSHITFALDLQDSFDPTTVEMWLKTTTTMQDNADQIPAVASLLQGLKGLTLTVLIGGNNKAKLSLDFNSSPLAAKKFLKPLFEEVIADRQVALEEIGGATADVEGDSFVLRMDISDTSLRHLLSLILSPTPENDSDSETVASQNDPSTTSPDPALLADPAYEASLRYLQSLITIMGDLERLSRKAKNYNQTATWHDKAAERIDNLPARGVNSELLKYGNNLGAQLRALAASMRGTVVEVNTQQNTLTYKYKVNAPQYGWGGPWGWGGGWKPATVNWESNIKDVREKQAKAVTESTKQREELWLLIKKEHNDIKAAMRKEFGDDFIDDLDGKKKSR